MSNIGTRPRAAGPRASANIMTYSPRVNAITILLHGDVSLLHGNPNLRHRLLSSNQPDLQRLILPVLSD